MEAVPHTREQVEQDLATKPRPSNSNNLTGVPIPIITQQKLTMPEPEEKMGGHHFEASRETPSSMNDEPATEIYHADGALTVNVRDAQGETGRRAAVRLAKDGCVSCFFEPPSP